MSSCKLVIKDKFSNIMIVAVYKEIKKIYFKNIELLNYFNTADLIPLKAGRNIWSHCDLD